MEELEIGLSSLKARKANGPDNISTEQIQHLGSGTKKWLLKLYNYCLSTHKLPKIWKKAHVLALLKSGRDAAIPENYRPISLLCHTYKLFERFIPNRVGPVVDKLLIPEQAGFHLGKSTTSQILNLVQFIEDGFEKRKVTGVVLVNLSAAYDTANHRCLHKILELTKDTHLTELIESMFENRYFYVELGSRKSKWHRQKNGLPQGSVLAPLLFNIVCFIYADDLALAAQDREFSIVERRLSSALDELTPYYKENHVHANPSKTQVCAFHLWNREANRKLNVSWCGTFLENCDHPVYLGVTLDRCPSFKTHVEKTKAKVCARNNIISKLTGTKWGASPATLRSSGLALCYSSAEYAYPAWERSTNAKKMDPALNATCCLITGCLQPTPTDSLYILSGIAPPEIQQNAASSREHHQQSTDSTILYLVMHQQGAD